METPKTKVIGMSVVKERSKSVSGGGATTIPKSRQLTNGDVGGGISNDESTPGPSNPFMLDDSLIKKVVENMEEEDEEDDEEEEDSTTTLAAQSGLPNLTDMPLHEWVAALTDPQTGRYPNGVTIHTMYDLVKKMGVGQFPSYDRARNIKTWKTRAHFAVMISEAKTNGRILHVDVGTYMGIFGKGIRKVSDPSSSGQSSSVGNQPPKGAGLSARGSSRKRNSSPWITTRRRRPSSAAKRVCIGAEPNSSENEPETQDDEPETNIERPPSHDSMDDGIGSSSNGDCPIDGSGSSSNGDLIGGPIDGADKGEPAPILASIPTLTTPRSRGHVSEIVSTITPITESRPTTGLSDSSIIGETSSCRPTVITSPAEEAQRSLGETSSSRPTVNTAPAEEAFISSPATEEAFISSPANEAQCSCPIHGTQRARTDIDQFGLPLLNMDDIMKMANNADSVAAMSNADVASLCAKLGFEDAANAVVREEIDGTALLLMRREDVTHSMGLRLGPAVKLHRLVRTMQTWTKNSMQAAAE